MTSREDALGSKMNRYSFIRRNLSVCQAARREARLSQAGSTQMRQGGGKIHPDYVSLDMSSGT